jgi:hypothetical protein
MRRPPVEPFGRSSDDSRAHLCRESLTSRGKAIAATRAEAIQGVNPADRKALELLPLRQTVQRPTESLPLLALRQSQKNARDFAFMARDVTAGGPMRSWPPGGTSTRARVSRARRSDRGPRDRRERVTKHTASFAMARKTARQRDERAATRCRETGEIVRLAWVRPDWSKTRREMPGGTNNDPGQCSQSSSVGDVRRFAKGGEPSGKATEIQPL